jgi:hypothetical protein
MSMDYPGRSASSSSQSAGSSSQFERETSKDTVSSVSSFAQDSVSTAARMASDATANLTGEIKQLLNNQIRVGAGKLGHVARSTRRAAEDLERDAPLLAGLVRSVASQTEGYAGVLRNQSVDDIWQSATDLTRRQPALVFGLAALAGFFVLRTIKSTPSMQLSSDYHSRGGSNLHGV